MTRAELAVALASRPTLSYFEQGTLNIMLERHLNVSSPRLTDVLYGPPPDGWDFPPRFIKEGTRNTSRLARDSEALISLVRHHPKDRRLELCLLLIDRLTQLKTLRCEIDPDGRIRYAANITGTETQRHAVHKSNTGTGYNLHSTTPGHRHLFLADEGHDMWNVDLAGADGWTIGCECAALGDPTMLNDLRAGLKPAQAVCLIYQHGAEANSWPYDRLLTAAKEIDKNGWLYMACKKIIWASAYGMGEQKQMTIIAMESFDETGIPTWVDVGTVRNMRQAVFCRYPGIRRRQNRITMLLQRDGYLDCANGSRRTFLGADPGFDHHPQVMTTYVTSLAWRAMWYDPENVRGAGSRIAQPLLLVHDSILFQSPSDRREWTATKVRQWFANSVTIAGTTITIPFSGGYGPSWAHAAGLPGYPQTGKI